MNTSNALQSFKYGQRKIAYRDAGSGEAVLLIHGFCGSSDYWKHVIPALSSQYRVIAPDLRGHGQSSYGTGTISVEQLADDMAALLEHLQIARTTVFGHSLGGYTALAFADRHPQLVQALSLVHSTAHTDTEEGKANRLKGMAAIRDNGIRPYVDGLIPKLFAPAHLSSMPDIVQECLELGYATDPEAAAQTLEAMRQRPDRNSVLQQLKAPVLLIAGVEDQVFPPSRVFSVEGPHIHTKLLMGVGHMSMLEKPESLITVMSDFLQQVHADLK